MPAPLLATKLYVPRPSAGALERPHRLDRSIGGLHRAASLVAVVAWLGGSP